MTERHGKLVDWVTRITRKKKRNLGEKTEIYEGERTKPPRLNVSVMQTAVRPWARASMEQ